MDKFLFSPKQKATILDALEHRAERCEELAKIASEIDSDASARLVFSFKEIADRARATVAAIETAEANGQEW